ncbi:Aspartate--tRNA(Asp/Asn) ligase [Leucobacter aridicollis]|uniref:Aspartate--tRNA ligase n=1 Tax=Leucobacter aridicollis TaxID=283878 RepID=A0A852R2Z6_9MICO|nr:aspartate--tRNA(Asn) ligase [Leucobacter aridicollis]MCS3429291.1 aspartyl-tRNA synthetase [Leucobacter aridicollis]NYD27981.1 aspartyl-tRNA synthetase [Leucobacter aridicollis]RKQ85894.1 aspartyl-tRNA synthetase [Mycolicibacterium mucogenicum 261Sha1.1M5]
MTERVLIKDLAARVDGPVRVSGWVEKVRDQRYVQFVVLRDESGAVQLVNGGVLREPDPENPRSDILVPRTTTISELTHGTFVTVEGELQHNERVKLGGVEIQIETIEVVTKALPDNPVADDSNIDVRLDWRFLDLRRPEQNLVFRVQTTFLHALRNVWVERGFIEIQTPKLMASASESRAELFEVEYFEGKAFLAQSPQFFKQMAQAAGFGGIFEVGPAFRADHSFTSRHATEFTSIDTELSWIDSHEDVMEIHEELIVAGLTAVKEKHGEEIQKLFNVDLQVPSRPFPRIPLAEAKEIVKARGYEIPRADADMDPEGERQIAAHVKEEFGSDFVFVTDYDVSIRPFYHMRSEENPELTKSYDLIYRGTEISTGAQREHRIEVLEAQARDKGMDPAELGFYLDFFRYGMPAHGGFGMGLNRVLMLMLEQPSIRETTYLFRGPNRLLP